jgi:TonB-dependent SusC/RagA subfamily outer membrane receptor
VGRFEQLLEGRMPGVTVERVANGDYSVHVRGGTSAANSGEPLIVIDGMVSPMGVSTRTVLSSIAPESVARIDVLKDGGSTAIYGSRGANGVILITTKR